MSAICTHATAMRPAHQLGPAGAILAVVILLLPGCSLLSIKTPEIPLSPREQEARLFTRDYAAHFANVMVRVTDAQSHGKRDAISNAEALRLKLATVTEITRTSTELSPIGSLLDTWAFALQLRDFLVTGAGARMLDPSQPGAPGDVFQLGEDANSLGRTVFAQDFPRYQKFVVDYVAHNPLGGVDFVRPSILAAWVAEQHDRTPLRAVGTVAQALGDVSDRLRIYGERVPNMALWQAEVALDGAGIDDASFRHAWQNMDAQLERISTLAETSPRLAHEAIAELRDGLRGSADRLDQSWMKTLHTLSAERAALADNIASERASLLEALDLQRVQLAADSDRIVARTVDTSWREARKLVREALLLLVILALVMLGLPFAAGYLVGRRIRSRRPESSL